MKSTKFLMFCIPALILLSCSESEVDPQTTHEGMVGNWAVTDVDYTGTTIKTEQGTSVIAHFTGTAKEMNHITTFTSNNILSEGSYVLVVNTTVGGHTTIEEVTKDEVFPHGTWGLDGNTLLIETVSNGSHEATVLEQTRKTLKIQWHIHKVEETDQDNTEMTDITGTYTFTKK